MWVSAMSLVVSATEQLVTFLELRGRGYLISTTAVQANCMKEHDSDETALSTSVIKCNAKQFYENGHSLGQIRSSAALRFELHLKERKHRLLADSPQLRCGEQRCRCMRSEGREEGVHSTLPDLILNRYTWRAFRSPSTHSSVR